MRTFKTMLEENSHLSARLREYFKRHGYKIIDHTDDETHQKIGVTFEIYDPKRDIYSVSMS